MEIIHSLQELPHSVRWVFAIGFFDGIHKGHQRVIGAAAELAAKHQAQLGSLHFIPIHWRCWNLWNSLLCCSQRRRRWNASGVWEFTWL